MAFKLCSTEVIVSIWNLGLLRSRISWFLIYLISLFTLVESKLITFPACQPKVFSVFSWLLKITVKVHRSMDSFSNMHVVNCINRERKLDTCIFIKTYSFLKIFKLNEKKLIKGSKPTQEELLLGLTEGLVGLIESLPQSTYTWALSLKAQTNFTSFM